MTCDVVSRNYKIKSWNFDIGLPSQLRDDYEI